MRSGASSFKIPSRPSLSTGILRTGRSRSAPSSLRFSCTETEVLSCLLNDMRNDEEVSELLEDEQKHDVEAMLNSKLEEMAVFRQRMNHIHDVEDMRFVDLYGDAGHYTGHLRNGEPHGHGTMIYDDKRRYEGQWDQGQYHGTGVFVFQNGDVYSGEFDRDSRHGKGKYWWRDGRYYAGDFVHDKRQGQGVHIWPDGAVYSGSFHDGKHSGKGIQRFACGSCYKGEWRQGQFHGEGKLQRVDGSCFEGTFSKGVYRGDGKEGMSDSSSNDKWENDLPAHSNHENKLPTAC